MNVSRATSQHDRSRIVPTGGAPHVLVVEDEPRIANLVRRILEAQVGEVTIALDGDDGLQLALDGRYDLVVLDLLLPGRDGIDVLAELMRRRPAQQVLVLSAHAEVEERVKCLRLGAADYLVKPFAIAELVARVQARLREAGSALPLNRSRPDVVLDDTRRTADVGAGPVHLTSKEYLVLQHLIDRAPGVSEREELLRDVWGTNADPNSNLLDVCVRRLRQKLGDELIETVRNVGYRLATSA